MNTFPLKAVAIPTGIPVDTCSVRQAWRILAMDDHYCVEKNGNVIGTVERTFDKTSWGWYPFKWGYGFDYCPLRDALRAAIRDCERP